MVRVVPVVVAANLSRRRRRRRILGQTQSVTTTTREKPEKEYYRCWCDDKHAKQGRARRQREASSLLLLLLLWSSFRTTWEHNVWWYGSRRSEGCVCSCLESEHVISAALLNGVQFLLILLYWKKDRKMGHTKWSFVDCYFGTTCRFQKTRSQARGSIHCHHTTVHLGGGKLRTNQSNNSSEQLCTQ